MNGVTKIYMTSCEGLGGCRQHIQATSSHRITLGLAGTGPSRETRLVAKERAGAGMGGDGRSRDKKEIYQDDCGRGVPFGWKEYHL